MIKYHLKVTIVVGDYFYFLSLPTPQRYKNIADEKRSCNNFFFASIFYAVNAKTSLVSFGYITNGIN